MKKHTAFLLIFIVALSSCTKHKIFIDVGNECINDFKIPCNNSISTKSFFTGFVNNKPICIFDGDGDFIFKLKAVTVLTSYPGEWIDPQKDTVRDSKKGLAFMFEEQGTDSFPVYFSILTPLYNNTLMIDIVDSLKDKDFLVFGDENNNINGYSFKFVIPCEKYSLSPMEFNTSINWLDYHYYDQSGKWIKVNSFSKKSNIFGQWEYDISFDLNVNIYTRRGYYGDLQGIFKTHFVLNK